MCLQDTCFFVEVAVTEEEHRRGLMFRESLSPDEGMLFVFDDERPRAFWMKNTLIPLDIIWINAKGKVVFIKKNAHPCGEHLCPSFGPEAPARYVLEINSGMAEKIGMTEGDTVRFSGWQK